MNKIFSKFILVFLLTFGFLFAQNNIIPCDGAGELQDNYKANVGGLFKPSSNGPGEFFRALIVFAQFAPDNNEVPNWPKDSLPTWAFNIIDSEPAQNYRPYTISDYFKRMSNGDFDFIGDVYPQLITVPTYRSYSDANVYVINRLNERIDDFRRYDNWYFNDGVFYFSEGEADGILDMLIIVYRKPDNNFGLTGGIADLGWFGSIILHDGIRINSWFGVTGSGITTQVRYWQDAFHFTSHLAHEYGHYLFGGFHTQMGGIMMGSPWGYHGTYAMNAWERERLGYITYQTAYNGQYKTLRDYVTFGDALKIDISQGEYFIIENHQRLNYFDQIIRGGALQGVMDPNSQLGKGIYIYYYKSGDIYPPEVYSIQADGGFEWQFAGRRTMYGWNDPPPVVPLLERGNVYRYLPNDYYEIGKCDRNKLMYFATDRNSWEYNYRWCDKDPLTKEWIISREPMGDETDAFTINGVDQITPWSNPSTTKIINGNPVLTGISIKLISQNGNDIVVRVFTNVNDGLSLPPSKPQKLVVAKNVSSQAVLTWSPNIEPDVIQGGSYKIYRGSTNGNSPPSNWNLIATIPAYVNGVPNTNYTDYEVFVGSGSSKLFYRITAVDNTGQESKPSDYDWIYWDQSMQKQTIKSYDYNLEQNYPNPFNPTTRIKYSVKEDKLVTIKLYDMLGREVATLLNEVKSPGEYVIELDAQRLGLSSGVYLYHMKSGDFSSIKKLVFVK